MCEGFEKMFNPFYTTGIEKAYERINGLFVFTDKLEELGDQPLRNFLEKLGGWPMVLGSAWDQSNFDLTHTLLTISLYNTEPLVDINVNTDLKNSTARILYVRTLKL